jgi:hypothetical protein
MPEPPADDDPAFAEPLRPDQTGDDC